MRNVKTRQSRYFAAKAHDERFVFKYCSTRGYLKQASVNSRPLRVRKKEREGENLRLRLRSVEPEYYGYL